MTVLPLLLMIPLFFVTTLIGVASVKKMISMYEARHELKQGSAGFLRSMSGWIIIVIWALLSIWAASFLGDWHTTGDLNGATDRAVIKLHIILEILAAMGDD